MSLRHQLRAAFRVRRARTGIRPICPHEQRVQDELRRRRESPAGEGGAA
ncbi:MAG: hypothetical protein KKA12_14510 [Alphaproteobacteria bacterium]|nr:hypothetical protein [Alphaproteobacteria bacterium]